MTENKDWFRDVTDRARQFYDSLPEWARPVVTPAVAERWHPSDDLENRVPDDVGLSRVSDGFWYLTFTYGRGPDHEHIEIKLDQDRFRQMKAWFRLGEPWDLSGESPSGAPTQPGSA